VYDNTFETNPLQELIVAPVTANSGTYKYNELVYQGSSITEATATAFVKKWDANANSIIVYDRNGTFEANTILVGAVSGAKYNVVSWSTDPNQLVNIQVTPTPNTANTEAEAFGFTTTINEYL
jgi:hypothetical protein